MTTHIQPMEPQSSFVEVRLAGKCDGTDFVRYYPDILEAFRRAQGRGLLLDHSEVDNRSKAILVRAYAEHLARHIPPGIPVAFVVPLTLPNPLEHLESAARSLGINLSVFSDRGEAIAWIVADPGQIAVG